MMQFLEAEIRQVAETVWDSVLGVTLVPRLAIPATPPRAVSGCVQFSGAWEGAVTIEVSAELARQAAATMFGVDPGAASPSDTQDAIGELANMTGGNVKALLPEPCRLSLPTVVEGADITTRLHGGELLTTVAFDCQGSTLVVRLLKKSENGKA
jgi:chemotaxis protein CheX